MISPNEIKIKAERKYKAYLQAIINHEDIFPLVIIGNKTPSKSIPEFKKELNELVAFSKEKKGFGYTISYQVKRTKSLGTQSLPDSIYFKTKQDFERYLKVETEVKQFLTNYKMIVNSFPELNNWLEKNPKKVIANSDRWNDILKVCDYFKSNPKPDLYIRELPISVHTKFLETNATVIKELLDIIIEPFVVKDKNRFEKRFNLKFSEPLIRFKILDSNVSETYFSGINDISIPVSHFNSLTIPIDKVIVVENKTNLLTIALTLPPMENTIVIFGSGFKVENLKKAKWLKEIEILYWGDIDVHGFEILSQMRGYFPVTKSILMDEITFEKFFENDEGTISKVNTLPNLTDNEMKLYLSLKDNNWRLEQEKIPLEYVMFRLCKDKLK